MFVWEDGTPWNWTSWADGQPNNIGDNQDCVTMFFSDLELYDYPCHTKLQPVCNIAEVNHIQGESKKSVISKNMAITTLKSLRKGRSWCVLENSA